MVGHTGPVQALCDVACSAHRRDKGVSIEHVAALRQASTDRGKLIQIPHQHDEHLHVQRALADKARG